MKYLGTIQDPKDLTTKEYVDNADTALSTRINTNEDNITMAESDIEGLQGDVNTLKTDNTSIKAAVQMLQDTYVPNTRKVNNKPLNADITLSASDVGAIAKVSPATEGNIPTLTADGQLVDSGKKADDLGGAFIVNLTVVDGSISADKTYAEIKSAHEAGKNVRLVYSNVVFDYRAMTNDDSLWFTGSTPYSRPEGIIAITNVYALLSVNSSNVWQSYNQSFVSNAKNLGDILMANKIPGGGVMVWESVASPYVSATDLAPTETTQAINANTLENHASSYFATASSVTDLTTLVNTINTFINSLATVATTGSYTDLSNQPTIPTIYSGTTDPSASLGKNGDIYIKYSN